MAVIIDEIVAEPQMASPNRIAPQPAPHVAPNSAILLEQLRFELLRDAHRQARIWVD